MAQIDLTLYKNLAESFHNARSQMVGAEDYLQDAVDYVVDITTDMTGGADIELALLSPVNAAKNAFSDVINSTSNLLDAVRAINNYVVNNTTTANAAAATAAGEDKLTYFINTTMDTTWDNSCCPYYWASLSSDAGYDTDGWQVCIS